MAVTSIWAVKKRMDTVIDYIENPEKTTERPELDSDALDARRAISDVIDYASNEDKTDKMMFVTGVNCDPDTALEDFLTVKQRWHKEGGRLAYHGYQAFKEGPGEITAEEAHEIGVKLAQELWGDRFQVVVATHLNTGHYHNHFVLNSVSFADGYKYVRFNSDYRKMQEVSDRLCRERGLDVVLNPSTAKGKTYDEWSAERQGRYTVRGRIREDIDYAVRLSRNWNDFGNMLTDLGYEMKFFRQDGTLLEHPALKPPEAKGFFRLDNLGKDYSFSVLQQRIFMGNVRPGMQLIPEGYTHKKWEPPIQEMHGLPKIYRWYCYKLYLFVGSPPRRKERIPMYLREDIRKLDKYIEQLDFLCNNGISDKQSMTEVRTKYQSQLDSLMADKKKLNSYLRGSDRDGNTEHSKAIRRLIQEDSRKIAAVRKKLKLCDECFVSSDKITEHADKLNNHLIQQKKPKNRNGRAR